MPSRRIGPGLRFVTNTSLLSSRSRKAAFPTGLLRSSTIDRLLRWRFNAVPDSCGWRPPPMVRLLSPSRVSTLMTSAPRSPRICVAYGPMTTVVRSSTRTPSRGPVRPSSCAIERACHDGCERSLSHGLGPQLLELGVADHALLLQVDQLGQLVRRA